ncbi:hypothetical protein SAMN05444166_4188 [Singulisphaera sp. GP187]|nr:hypothetical protein SAMN05444166_4188 [Singulisphaera sp. GP187]
MAGKSQSPLCEDRPHIERVTRIAHDHILYANGHPSDLQIIADRLGISPESALAYAIAEQVTEEFFLTPQPV